jgi:plastocyanin
MFAKAFILSSVALLVSAANYDVTVGGLDSSNNPILKFNPEFVNANLGDTVTFHFQQKNHSVVQTSFAQVCEPLLDATTYQPVFQTAFHPVAVGDTDFPTEVYTVTNTSKPLWFYCSQTLHCGKGMVFSINCPSTGTNTLAAFEAAALAFGAEQAAEASSASAWSATATPDVYGGMTYAPVYAPTVTDTVTFGESTWTTTYQSYENSPDPTPVAAAGVVHTVTVGANGTLTYDPPSIQANVRDTVKFVFAAKNHTITQSSFADPCRKLQFTSTTGQIGFDSGFVPGEADGSATFSITVNDTQPIWAYCRQTGHCGQGMVFAINSDESSDRNFAAFENLAKTINGTNAATPSASGSVTGNSSGFMSASVLGGAASIVLVGFGSVVALLL